MIKNKNPKIEIGNDTSYCENSGIKFLLSAGLGLKKYLWNTNEYTPAISISGKGKYKVTVWDSLGCPAFDSLNVIQKPNPYVNLRKDSSYCSEQGISIILRAGKGQKSYRWSTSEITDSIKIKTGGLFYAEVTNNENCKSFDTIRISENQSPKVSLGSDK